MTYWLPRIIFFTFIALLPSAIVLAEGFVSLVGVPGLPEAHKMDMQTYVNALYILAIGAASVLAVLRIIFAGAKYIFTDVVSTKGDAKKDIQNVILGLLVILSAVLILTTINPNLKNLNALGELKPNRTDLKKIERPGPPGAADECIGDTKDYVISSEYPNGACIDTINLTDGQDYTDSPGEGSVKCHPLSYDPATNKCYNATETEPIPNFENFYTNYGCDSSDLQCISEAGRSWCNSNGKDYVEKERACIDLI